MVGEKGNQQPANTSTSRSTRETYIDHLDRLLQLHEQLGAKLSSLQTASNSADSTISEARQSLGKSLKGTNIATAVGSSVSIVGGLLMLSPFLFVGAGLVAAGAATSFGSSIAKEFFLEKDAATAFEQAISKYGSSSNELQSLLQQIEDAKEQLVASLIPFLAALHTEAPSMPPNPGGTPANPRSSTPGGSSPFSFAAFQGIINGGATTKPWLGAGTKTAGELAEWLAKNGGTAGQVLGKTLPILSIPIDVASIVTTWTGINETLEKADNLRKQIQSSTDACRQTVQQYLSAMEELVGSPTLQDNLRKLIRLRTAIPGRPGGPPGATDPDQPCKMLAQMEKSFDVPFWIFASLQGQSHDDSTQNDYVTDLVPEADVLQLSQEAMTAPVVDSLFESYPDINLEPATAREDKDKEKDKPPQVDPLSGIGIFRLKSKFVGFGEREVYNVDGSMNDNRVNSWVVYWKWWFAKTRARSCLGPECYIRLSSTTGLVNEHKNGICGGHLEPKDNYIDRKWYILPICGLHNAPRGMFDRHRGGHTMTTKKPAWAVQIPKWR